MFTGVTFNFFFYLKYFVITLHWTGENQPTHSDHTRSNEICSYKNALIVKYLETNSKSKYNNASPDNFSLYTNDLRFCNCRLAKRLVNCASSSLNRSCRTHRTRRPMSASTPSATRMSYSFITRVASTLATWTARPVSWRSTCKTRWSWVLRISRVSC